MYVPVFQGDAMGFRANPAILAVVYPPRAHIVVADVPRAAAFLPQTTELVE